MKRDLVVTLPPSSASDRPSEVAVDMLLRLLAGQVDAATIAQWRHASLRWLRGDGSLSLSECLHLGANPRRVRLAIRDRWLGIAAGYVDGTAWQRAKILQREADRFVMYRWPSWRKLDAMPLGRGTPIECCLFGAMKAEASLPTTTEGWYTIITKQVVGTC